MCIKGGQGRKGDDNKEPTFTTEGKANQEGISSPARNILRNFVPDKDMMLRFFSLAYSWVT